MLIDYYKRSTIRSPQVLGHDLPLAFSSAFAVSSSAGGVMGVLHCTTLVTRSCFLSCWEIKGQCETAAVPVSAVHGHSDAIPTSWRWIVNHDGRKREIGFCGLSEYKAIDTDAILTQSLEMRAVKCCDLHLTISSLIRQEKVRSIQLDRRWSVLPLHRPTMTIASSPPQEGYHKNVNGERSIHCANFTA